MTAEGIRLTQYSHGAGCGCKIAPDVLSRILAETRDGTSHDAFPSLLVGHQSRDDAAAVILDEHRAVLSTTDFFMPIVTTSKLGRIAATNAISDIYAMEAPQVAIAILGWPIDTLAPEIANRVVQGGREVRATGVPTRWRYSTTPPSRRRPRRHRHVRSAHLKQNSGACAGDLLILTKPLGIGIHTTAEKQGRLKGPSRSRNRADVVNQVRTMARLGVKCATDVTGFGLAGHLMEMCSGANLSAAALHQHRSYRAR